MIIKLTEVPNELEDEFENDRELYVNVDHIESMWVLLGIERVGTVTVLKMASGEIHWVRETLEQIVNM